MHKTSRGLANRIFELLEPCDQNQIQSQHPFYYEFPIQDVETIYDVIYSIIYNTTIQPEVLVCSLGYIRKFLNLFLLPFTNCTWYRVTVTALLVSAKTWDDRNFCNNNFVQTVADINLELMSQLELIFCFTLDFRVLMNEADYDIYYKQIFLFNDENEFILFEGAERTVCKDLD
ncbi:Cyclin_fold protein [Hexamita inflata]|uniref:Cyclin fold protein n=1 Tax=Hexamita inflata TaxID=28002 RepID=A0AA86U3T9_9EUKA|nr:Cyclin fold protein [Hexamita inflata]